MAIIIVMILTLSLFSLYINKREKRSATSFVSEQVLRLGLTKMRGKSEEASIAFLEERGVKNEEPFTLPIKTLPHCTVELTIAEGIECITFTPRKDEIRGNILYFHGGGYVEHASIIHFFFIDSVLRLAPMKVVMPLYPKAPVHHARETVSIVEAFYDSMIEDRTLPFIVMGDSAGGGLALALAQRKKRQPKEIILLSPWLDIALNNSRIQEYQEKDPMLSIRHLQIMGNSYKGDLDEKDQRVSPLFGEISHLAPITLFVGTHEIFLPDARIFKQRCDDEGKELIYTEKEKMNHDYPLFPMKEGKEAISLIAKVLLR